MQYFAYGSNMSVPRLRQRVPSALVLDVAVLHGHRLAFHKAGRDGSAKCDIAVTGHQADAVHGVLYTLDPKHKAFLDQAEGLGMGYELKSVDVKRGDGATLVAFTYFATRIDPQLRPYSWYLRHVIRGAKEHELPGHYVASIASIDTIDDPDRDRHEMELAIYA
ncbi:MAG: gamma-glutamylcyclotransferase [Gammaproteobacteria bacterium]|nr:gamma-glutamylcyclotransferase [Gammaproteobacteria bacterium]